MKTGLIGTIYLGVFVLVLALPLGVCAAVYMEEYAKDTKLTRFINTNIRNLAGVPAIVYGILGLAIFVELLKPVTGPGSVGGRSLLAGGLTIALMVLPIVIITTQEALRAVPKSIREAGFGVGATRWEVIRSHVLPYAAPGVLTGSVLAMARALGETAPLIMVGAVTGFLATEGGVVQLAPGTLHLAAHAGVHVREEAPGGVPAARSGYHPRADRLHLLREPDGHPAEEPI